MKFTKINKLKVKDISVIKLLKTRITLDSGFKKTITYFYRHKIKYFWDPKTNQFHKLKPNLKQPIGDILADNQIVWKSDVQRALIDKNNLVFPLPNFG